MYCGSNEVTVDPSPNSIASGSVPALLQASRLGAAQTPWEMAM